MFQLIKPKLDVFLAHNKEMKECDFHVKGSWIDRSSVIYAGKSDVIVAQVIIIFFDYLSQKSKPNRGSYSYIVWSINFCYQMHKKHTAQSILIGKSNFSVTVYPNVDYAFIVSLIVILDDINREDSED